MWSYERVSDYMQSVFFIYWLKRDKQYKCIVFEWIMPLIPSSWVFYAPMWFSMELSTCVHSRVVSESMAEKVCPRQCVWHRPVWCSLTMAIKSPWWTPHQYSTLIIPSLPWPLLLHPPCYYFILIFNGVDCQSIILLESLLVCGTWLVINPCELLNHGNLGTWWQSHHKLGCWRVKWHRMEGQH